MHKCDGICLFLFLTFCWWNNGLLCTVLSCMKNRPWIHFLLHVKRQIINTFFHTQLWSRGERKDIASATFGASTFCANGEKMLDCIWFCFFFFLFYLLLVVHLHHPVSLWCRGLSGRFALSDGTLFALICNWKTDVPHPRSWWELSFFSAADPWEVLVSECQVEERWGGDLYPA